MDKQWINGGVFLAVGGSVKTEDDVVQITSYPLIGDII